VGFLFNGERRVASRRAKLDPEVCRRSGLELGKAALWRGADANLHEAMIARDDIDVFAALAAGSG
jgi:hypothetical protein